MSESAPIADGTGAAGAQASAAESSAAAPAASASSASASAAPASASASAAGGEGEDGAGDAGELNPNRVKVKKWTAVAFWSYDIENDTCAICHNQLMVPCITCEAEPHHAEDCSVAWGQCGHSYHFHCITRWLKTRSTCPLDDEEWDFVQY